MAGFELNIKRTIVSVTTDFSGMGKIETSDIRN